MVAPESGAKRVRVWSDTDEDNDYSDDGVEDQFFAYGSTYGGGVRLAAGDTDLGGSQTELVTVPGTGTGTRPGLIRDLDVFLGITHTFDEDLDITLVHVPSGTSVTLFTDVAGGGDGFMIRLNDEAGTDIGSAVGVNGGAATGEFNPEGAALLSAFDGIDASGLWQLQVTDDELGDAGSLFAWELQMAV